MKHIAPAWARVLIAPAIAFFILVGLGLVLTGIYIICFDRNTLVGLLLIPIGVFFIVAGWKGRCLFTFRNIMAGLEGDALKHSNGPKGTVVSTSLSDIVIVSVPWLKIIHIDSASTGRRLMSIDYCYKNGVLLLMEIQRRMSEQENEPYKH